MKLSQQDGIALLAAKAPNGQFPDGFDIESATEICTAAGTTQALDVLRTFMARQKELLATPKPKGKGREQLKWEDVPNAKIPGEAQKQLDAIIAAKKSFSDIMNAAAKKAGKLPAGKKLIFSYRYDVPKYAVANVASNVSTEDTGMFG